MLAGLAQDFRFAIRVLLKKPAFTAVAVLTLALGIGASTAIFSEINGILLHPYPYPNADRMVAVMIHDTAATQSGYPAYFPPPEFLDYAEQNHAFQDVVGGSSEDVLYTTPDGTVRYKGGLVTFNNWQFFGVIPVVGRVPTEADVRPGATPVFVMSYKTWVGDFNKDPSIVGKSFVLNDVPTTLVGVMPLLFRKLDADVLFPVAITRSDPLLANRYFLLQAMLKPGITDNQATAEMNEIAKREAKVYPRSYPKQFKVQVVPLVLGFLSQFSQVMFVFAGAVGLILLIACSNVANMLLAQASAREKEMAIRSALGASRWRIVRQLLIESLLLALGGAALGWLLAYGGIKGIHSMLPAHLGLQDTPIPMNWSVLLFTLGVAVGTAVLFGLVPALQTARRDVVEPLKDSGHGVSGGFRRGKFRSVLVVVEVALSLVLLAGAGLMIRIFTKLVDADLGFDPRGILVARTPFPKGRYLTAASQQAFFNQLMTRVDAMPGVVSSSVTVTLPPFGDIDTNIDIPGKVHTDDWKAGFNLCSDGYFQTIGQRLLRGQLLTQEDVADAHKVAVVNQALVAKYFGTEDPIGREIKIEMLSTMPQNAVPDPTFEIVGVTADQRNQGLIDPPAPELFIPYTIVPFGGALMIHTAGDPALFVNPLRHAVWAVDRGVAMTDAESLEWYIERYSYADPRFALTLLGIFSGLGLALVAIGVYSVTAYTVSRQTHEIGIRMALGAERDDVLRMVMWMGLQLIALGVAAGLLASWWATRLVANQISNVTTHDPLTLVGVTVVLLAVGCAACYFPARRATRVDPMIALRYE